MSVNRVLCARCDRRRFLHLGGLLATGALLVACGGSPGNDTAESQPDAVTQAPTAAPTIASSANQSVAQANGVACRTGIVDDAYPGHCRHYVDRNGNGYCDLSELGSGSVTPRY